MSTPPSISLRPITPDDHPFLYRVYASTREEELAPVPWSAEQKHAFLSMQFNAQHYHYTTHSPNASYDVVVHGDEPVGRLYVDRRADELRIIDIALLPEHRGKGIGTFLLRRVLDEAAAAGKPVRIHVERNNPALGLYKRLGFVPVQDLEIYYLLEYPTGHSPAAVPSSRGQGVQPGASVPAHSDPTGK